MPFTAVYNFVNLGDASSTLTQIQAYSIPIFAATVVLAAVFIGLMIGGHVTRKLVTTVGRSIRTAVGLGGGRRSRRRRR